MTAALTELIDQVRLLHNQFMTVLAELHRDVELRPSQRAVMEHLLQGGVTVPALARGRGVTRQHIQAIVNGLMDEGLADTIDNPAHKRSPFIVLSPRGESAITAAIDREQQFIATYLGGLDEARIRAAAATLSEFRQACASGLTVAEDHHD